MNSTVKDNVPLATSCSRYIKAELEAYLSDDLICLLNRETNSFTKVYITAIFDWVVEKFNKLNDYLSMNEHFIESIGLISKVTEFFCIVRVKHSLLMAAKVLDTKSLASALYLPESTKGLSCCMPNFYSLCVVFKDQSSYDSYDFMFSTTVTTRLKCLFHDGDNDEELQSVSGVSRDEDDLADHGQYGMKEID